MFAPDLEYLKQQHTIAEPRVFVGIGLHSGQRATLRLLPAEPGHGIVLVRRDLPPQEAVFKPNWDQVAGTDLCTTLGNAHGHEIATVEHLLSALYAVGVDNVRIEVDGPEIPVMDGSAAPFVAAVTNAGLRALQAPRQLLVVRRRVHLQIGESWAELLPDPMPRVTVSIDFNQRDIGTQSLSFCLSANIYKSEIAPARTFGFAEHLWQLRRRGLARGGSIKNAVLLREGRVANREGLRFRDEFVRHKALDVIGDLALAGAPIIGHYRSHRPGHRLNVELLRLLMNDRSAWTRVSAEAFDALVIGKDQAGTAGKDRPADGQEKDAAGLAHETAHRPITERILRLFNDDHQ
jgi:UDP-3-O-[3-hydroxymyristoyl] N-acetylglucosamine deacetylase